MVTGILLAISSAPEEAHATQAHPCPAHQCQPLGRLRHGPDYVRPDSLIEVLKADEDLLHASDARAQAQTESARVGVAAFKALDGGWQSRKSER